MARMAREKTDVIQRGRDVRFGKDLAQGASPDAVSQSVDVDRELSELCKMMRVMSERDVDATLAQVLKTMLLHSRDRPLGGSELSELSGLNRITVIHHLKRLEGAGFVSRQETKYVLRVHSAEDMLLEFRREMEQAFAEMDELAQEIDRHFEEAGREAGIFRKQKLR